MAEASAANDRRPDIEPLSVTIKEAKRITGLGVTTLYAKIGAGELQTVKIGGRRLLIYSSIKKMLGLSVPA